MRKAYQYRIYPTKAQTTMLNQHLELCRWVFNQTLAMRKDAWEQEERSVSYFETKRMLPVWKKEKPELKQVYSQALQNVTERVDLAFKAFFRRVKSGEDKAGYPNFKKYGLYTSLTYPQSQAFEIVDDETVRVSKVGNIKINLHRPIGGVPKTLTIRRDRVGKWYASFSCEVEPNVLPEMPDVIGVDVGLSSFATLSDGVKIENPRFFKQEEKALKKAQRKVSALPRGSSERRKAVKALNHIHERVSNRRKDFAHKLSRELVNKYQVVCLEKLEIKDMMDSNWRSMNRSIADVAWQQFAEMVQTKAKEAGRTVVMVNPRGTTQRCSRCGEIVPKDLSVRVHDCNHCGLVLDRDHNAALNILARGLSSLDLES